MTAFDGGAMTICTIQVNLAAGTSAQQAVHRPELVTIVEDLLQFRKQGQFMMTEIGHGLDLGSMETTATLLSSGEFVIHKPTPAAATFMPPTVPAGLPTVAIVWAKITRRRGPRSPSVRCPDQTMASRCAPEYHAIILLSQRVGPTPINHSITTFSNVRIPSEALLGFLEASKNPKLTHAMRRIATGTAAIAGLSLPIMKAYATIGAMYSMRRHVGPPGNRTPIISFRTQQIPILTMTAQVYVMEAFLHWAQTLFSDVTIDYRVRHAVAAVVKFAGITMANAGAIAISDRCGVQGLFAHNQITTLHHETRGIAIAEGDVLVLSIKCVTEMLQGRYTIPSSKDPKSLLARHEAGLFEESRAILASSSSHRSNDANRLILPQCRPIMEAIGHRMAYDAAVAAGVQQDLIDLFVASAVKDDAAWYSENASFYRRDLVDLEAKALDAVLPQLETLVKKMGMEPWITVQDHHSRRLGLLPGDCAREFDGNGRVEMFPTLPPGKKRHLRHDSEMVRSHL